MVVEAAPYAGGRKRVRSPVVARRCRDLAELTGTGTPDIRHASTSVADALDRCADHAMWT